MRKINKILITLGLLSLIIFSFYIYRNEFKVLADPNDNIFQYALVDQAKNIWKNIFNGKLSPLYLLDNWNERWGDGFALSNYYSHLPQALIALFGGYKLFVILRTLLLVFLPLMFFWGSTILRLPLGFSLILVFFSQVIFTNGLYGIDASSFIWRGWGLSAELMATFFIPVAFAYAIDYFENKKNLGKAILFNFIVAESHIGIFLLLLISYGLYTLFKLFTDQSLKLNSLWTDIIYPFLKFSIITLFSLSYFIVPFFTQGQYRNFSVWDPIWKFDSWGVKQIAVWLLNGELFDFGRFPILTLLVIFGVFYGLIEKKKLFNYLSLLFIFFTVLFFGRTTLSKLVDLIPGFSEYHIHRVIVLVQFIGLFLAAWFFYNLLVLAYNKALSYKKLTIIFLLFFPTILLILVYYLEKPVIKYAQENNIWVERSNKAYLNDLDAYNKIKTKLTNLPPARIYAGRPGNWGKGFFVGEIPMYMNLTRDGFPVIEFLPESWSPNADPEQFFDENNIKFYDLYKVGYSVLPPEINPPSFAKLITKEGRYSLYQIPVNSWFTLGKANLMVRSGKNNLLNITRLWFDSRSFNEANYPVIDLRSGSDLNPTLLWSGKLWQIKMNDLNNFTNLNDSRERNIWSANPFTAVESSAVVKTELKNEKITANGYQADINLSNDCNNCLLILKQTYHPNWKVILDGSIVPTFPVFPFYLGISLEKAGNHKVVAEYQPGKVKVYLAVIEILVFGGLIIYLLFRRRAGFLR